METKVVTICGSMKFAKEMMKVSEKLELEDGYVVIQCIYNNSDRNYEKSEIEILDKLHKKKIEISDAIYVVNVGGYIGESTKNEIEFAKSLKKEIYYYE